MMHWHWGLTRPGELQVECEDGKEKVCLCRRSFGTWNLWVCIEGEFMYQDKIVLCGANSYEEKFYMNPDFDNLPQHIKDELKIMCVLYVHDVGGNPYTCI